MSRQDTDHQISRRAVLHAAGVSGAVGQINIGSAPRAAQRYTIDASAISYGGGGNSAARRRSVSEKLAERISLLDFDVDPSGRNDSTIGFKAAMNEVGAGELFIPPGRFLVEGLGLLSRAGRKIVGASRWETVLLTERGGSPLFTNEAAATGTSAFHTLSDFMIDLNGQDITAIDLAGINASSIERVHIKGAHGEQRRGVGLHFSAPLRKGAYDNVVRDCTFEYLRSAIKWGEGANNNSAFSSRISNCDTGLDIAPTGLVDTPRVFGGRIEACRIGLKEGAQQGGYYGIRFEANSEADIVFVAGSENAGFWGGATASSKVVVRDLDLAKSPTIESSDLGQRSIEENNSRPKISTGRHVIGAAGKAPAVHPARDYAAYFPNYILLGHDARLEFVGASGDDDPNGRVEGLRVNDQAGIVISAYSHQSQTYGTVSIGGGTSVAPITHAVTSLGNQSEGFTRAYLTDGVFIDGKQVLKPQAPAIPPDSSESASAETINAVLRILEYHGLIAKR